MSERLGANEHFFFLIHFTIKSQKQNSIKQLSLSIKCHMRRSKNCHVLFVWSLAQANKQMFILCTTLFSCLNFCVAGNDDCPNRGWRYRWRRWCSELSAVLLNRSLLPQSHKSPSHHDSNQSMLLYSKFLTKFGLTCFLYLVIPMNSSLEYFIFDIFTHCMF